MILILLALFLLGSLALLALRRDKEAWLVLGLVVSFTVFWLGILLYVAKKGGILPEVTFLFYLTRGVQNWFRYQMITLGQLGFLVAIGRYTFPPMLLALAAHYTLTPALRWVRKAIWAAPVLPAVTLALYQPRVFEWVTAGAEWRQKLIVQCSMAWIWAYLALAAGLILFEYFSTTIRFFRQRYLMRAVLPLMLAVMFAIYCPQDPAQIYLFYRNDYMWLLGLWYLNPAFSVTSYVAVLGLTGAAGVVGFFALLRSTRTYLSEDQEEMVLQRKFAAASMGVSVFVHSMKNQLLANRVLHKRIRAALEADPPDIKKLREYTCMLDDSNEALLTRMEELYRSVKAKALYLAATPAGEIIDRAVRRFRGKYPEGRVEVTAPQELELLADPAHLAEALYNLLVNAWEATLAVGGDTPVRLRAYSERLYTVLEVTDRGGGIPRSEQKKIFEPFYSSKNSNSNWGMGLYYVRQIAKSHLGHLRFETEEGKGTRFVLMLPRYADTPAAARRGKAPHKEE